jgi:hypothetical protein
MAAFGFWRTQFIPTDSDKQPGAGEIDPENPFGGEDDNLEPLDMTEGIGGLAGRLNDPVETPSTALHHMEIGRFGLSHGRLETPGLPRVWLTRLYFSSVAIDLLPGDVKADYLTAKREVPELVASETAPMRFLVRSEFDPWAAARRLCAHWTFRKQTFDDRWLRPMDLSGQGCLTEADVRILQSGGISFPTAENGIQTMTFDMTKLMNHVVDFRARSRCAMYLGTMCATDASRRRGYDVLFLASSAGVRPSPQNGLLVLKGRTSSMCKLREVYIVRDPTDSKKVLVRYCVAFVCKVLEKVCGILPHVITEENAEAIAAKLVEHGMERGCIPQDIAGSRNYDRFISMIEARIQMDMHKHSFQESGAVMQESPTGSDTSEIASGDDLFDTNVFHDMDIDVHNQLGYAVAPVVVAPAVARATPTDAYSARWAEHSTEHSTTAVEAYGTDLILRACTELDQGERFERNDNFFRKRNALYSRRNYQRRKENEGKLQTEHADLRYANRALASENTRLLALLEQADAVVGGYTTPEC